MELIEQGYQIVPDFISTELINELIVGMENADVICSGIKKKNGVDNAEATVHHLPTLDPIFLRCLEEYEKIDDVLHGYFGGKYILHSFGGNLLSKKESYASEIHRDIRSHSKDLPLVLNTLIMLDDFTKNNGGTWIWPQSRFQEEKPSVQEFYKNAFQITGKAGTLVMFNSNVWHAAGANTTHKPRRSLTPMFSRPFIKQGYDYPRALGHCHKSYFSKYMQQVLGYNSLVPESHEDWYRPKEERFYQGDQG